MQNNPQDKQEQIKAAYENRIDVEYIPPTVFRQSGEERHERKRVAPYCRVSTSSEDQRASYETQIQAYKDYVSKHEDWVLVDIYADEGISGTSLRNRTDFKRMIDDCKAGKIDMIITKNISRFARNVVDCVLTARNLKNLTPPVAIFFEDVGINTLTQTGELLLVILAAIAQGESETKSASVKWGFQKRFEAGLPKIGDEFWAGGYCGDAFIKNPPKRDGGNRKTGRAYRRKMHRKNIQKYRNRDSQGWPIYGPYIHGHWDGDEYILGTYVEYPKSSKNKVFYKRVSNKKVRRSKDIPPKGNGYRKVFDYWWTIT